MDPMRRRTLSGIGWTLLIVTIIALSAQVVHFGEHVAQVTVWIFGAQQKAYMTPLGMWCMNHLGTALFPQLTHTRQLQLGFEFLHLIGNGVFVLGLTTLLYFLRTPTVWWSFGIELFHFYEHVSLSYSALYIGKAIGVSTFFGAPVAPWTLLAYRVWWHFIFNLVPTILVVMALLEANKALKKKRRTFVCWPW